MKPRKKPQFVILNGVKDLVYMSVNQTRSHEILRFAQDDKLLDMHVFVTFQTASNCVRLLKKN